ncbi:MAG: methionine adenosyltransferase, partial [Clostridia bacterium]|nr:methionine adenosyltransferase [Clostridia bacterium]
MLNGLFTSESVTSGHPDKLCDLISDSILDAILEKDPYAHVACETTAAMGLIHVMGEITTDCYVDIEKIVRQAVKSVGYTDSSCGFDGNTCGVIVSINSQSPDIAMGVNASIENKFGDQSFESTIGAGDQGLMFGFACDETAELMPLPISLAHSLAKRLEEARNEGIISYLRPDGKTQVTIQYENGIPVRVDTIVVSAQHAENVDLETIKSDVVSKVIIPTIPPRLIDKDTKIFVNPTGRFVIGGPAGDSGLTGRKIIVDTYGGMARHGGGAFSGKDPTKVDRSAAYAARYIAKNVVAAGIAKKCEVQIAYAIGVSKPVSVMVDTFGTSCVSDECLSEAISKIFDLRPSAIIENFGLRKPIYSKLSSY